MKPRSGDHHAYPRCSLTFVFHPQTGQDVKVASRNGYIWITIEGEAGDFVIAPGQIFTLPIGHHAVIEALGNKE